MLAVLRTRYSILYAQEMVEQCVQSCDPCQFLQRTPPPSQPLHPIPRVDAGDVWAFDFIGPLPKTLKGNQYLLTAMDLGTDWTIAQALPRRSGQSVLEMLQYIMYTYGKPLRILTDNGEEFMSYGVQGMLQRFGIRHDHTTPYHPQTNGRLEKFNDILTQMLARMTAPQRQTSWDQALPDALLAHRAHTSSSTVARRPNEILQTKKLNGSRKDDWSMFKIWLASDRKQIRGLPIACNKKRRTKKRSIGKGHLVLEIL